MAGDRLRIASLSVIGGSLHGRRHELEEAVGEILVGSDPDCHLVVDLPSISPIHARVWADIDEPKVHDTHAPRGVYVNTTRVEGEAPLLEGDVIWLGPPADADSVCVQPVFEPWVEVLPFAVAADTEVAANTDAAPSDDAEAPADDEPLEVVDEVEPRGTEPEPPPPWRPPPPDSSATTAFVPGDLAQALPVDPFFVGEAEAPSLDTPLAVGGPALEDDRPPAPLAADDWVIADAAAPAPAGPSAEAPADDFFVADVEPVPPAVPPRAPLPPQATPAVRPAPPPTPEVIEPAAASPVIPAAPRVAVPPPAPPSVLVIPPSSPAAAGAAATSAGGEASAPAAAARPRPESPHRGAASPSPRPSPARRPGARPAARRASSGPPSWLKALGLVALGLVVLGGLGFGAWRLLGGRIRVDSIEPSSVRSGQRVVVTGQGFAKDQAANSILFGDKAGRVLSATPVRLEVEVPAGLGSVGGERSVDVVVRAGRAASPPFSVALVQGPVLAGLSPQAGEGGDAVLLAGSGWGPGVTVRFGTIEAQVVELNASQIRVVVPLDLGAPGTSAPVTVSLGGVQSNSAPFYVGHLPLVTGIAPASAAPGDLVRVSGLGFDPAAEQTEVTVAGVRALVLKALPDQLDVVIPLLGAGGPERTIEIRVHGDANVAKASLQLPPAGDSIEARFVAEPFAAVPGRTHAVVATGVGPAFVLAASGGRTAAARAFEAQGRLNTALEVVRTTVGLNFEARGLATLPVIGLPGRPDPVLEVRPEDAVAYNEDWTSLRGRGGPVTPGRLARWWEAVARDLVLLTVRGERPQFAGALAAEGRVLGQLFDAARKSGRPGLPRALVDEARPPLREALRLVALRVPAAVAAPPGAPALPVPGAVSGAAGPSRLVLDGMFRGSEVEEGQRRYLTVTFGKGSGTIAYEGGITFTVPLASLEQRGRDQARFSVQIRGGMRYYAAKWDGEKLSGPLSSDAAGHNVVGSFELRPR